MTCLKFWSDDSRFGLEVEDKHVSELLRLCRQSCPNETGGILLGQYTLSHHCAIVTVISHAPADSRSGRTWFIRGIRGLQRVIDRLWQREHVYYLGEWHFHPFGSPLPSPTDIDQMQEISRSEQYHCPEPLLLIIGGDPSQNWSARAYVFPRELAYIEMVRQAPTK